MVNKTLLTFRQLSISRPKYALTKSKNYLNKRCEMNSIAWLLMSVGDNLFAQILTVLQTPFALRLAGFSCLAFSPLNLLHLSFSPR